MEFHRKSNDKCAQNHQQYRTNPYDSSERKIINIWNIRNWRRSQHERKFRRHLHRKKVKIFNALSRYKNDRSYLKREDWFDEWIFCDSLTILPPMSASFLCNRPHIPVTSPVFGFLYLKSLEFLYIISNYRNSVYRMHYVLPPCPLKINNHSCVHRFNPMVCNQKSNFWTCVNLIVTVK